VSGLSKEARDAIWRAASARATDEVMTALFWPSVIVVGIAFLAWCAFMVWVLLQLG
jgi:hypothetical protein